MAEVSDNAIILITTSFQAYNRAIDGIPANSEQVNLMVAQLFLGFYLEETINVIISKLKKESEVEIFNDNKPFNQCGLLNKFWWFLNSYISQSQLRMNSKRNIDSIKNVLELNFPGFKEILEFRNQVSHGEFMLGLNISGVFELREKAKVITDSLLNIVASKEGMIIAKDHSYKVAADLYEKSNP